MTPENQGTAAPVSLFRQAMTKAKGAQIEQKSMWLARFVFFAECSNL
jgi:hypothetical protein